MAAGIGMFDSSELPVRMHAQFRLDTVVADTHAERRAHRLKQEDLMDDIRFGAFRRGAGLWGEGCAHPSVRGAATLGDEV